MITKEKDSCFSIEDNRYSILKVKDVMLLKRIFIEKKPLIYSFIGGMWYSKEKFSLENNISLPYPFSSYYTLKILDKYYKGTLCRSLIYSKMPILAIQFKNECFVIEFDPVCKTKNQEFIPFISLGEKDDKYIISFYLFKEFLIKEKDNAWLGFGKKRKINLDLVKGDNFYFSINIKKYKNWDSAVKSFISKKITKIRELQKLDNIFENGKQALWRSYDSITGSFLQLPWRNSPNFTFVNSSYSLISYEAVRLHYFTKWYKKTNDDQFLKWSSDLRSLFINPNLLNKTPKEGKGILWYNMSNLTRNGLQGFFYLDCGYAGYPGGQATIALHLLKYLEYVKDIEIENLIKKSLDYILSTQKINGSWPMAIHQDGYIKIRSENLSSYETSGGIAESARALLQGYKKFNNEKLKNSALKALDYLETNNPICYNGLRDIGIQEPEAFSAIIIIDSFLDAYKITKDKRYIKNALIYAYYTLTWFYLYNTEKLCLEFNFHPISFSITPRLSPYENIWIVSTYLRLYKYTKDIFWKKIAQKSYNVGINWITNNGGLCEGIFPNYLSDLNKLPMEQTFATIELMNASLKYYKPKKKNEDDNYPVFNKEFEIKKENEIIDINYKNNIIFSFDLKKFKVTYLKDIDLNEYGISFSFYNPYSIKNMLIQKIKKYLRGSFGKYILGALDAKYFLKGVYKKNNNKIRIVPFEKIKKTQLDAEVDRHKVKIFCETKFHRIELTIKPIKKGKKIHIIYDPIIIKILDHDISCENVLFPLIGYKLSKKNDDILQFKDFSIKGKNSTIIVEDDFTAINQTLSTNWTHGGIYKGKYEIILNKI